MVKKLVYIAVICCLGKVNLFAQQSEQAKQELLHFLQPFKNNIKLIDNNLSGTCAIDFRKKFRKVDTTDLDTKTSEQLLKTAKDLLKTYKKPEGKCSNKITNKIDTLTRILIGKLTTSIKRIEGSLQVKTVQLTVAIVDSTNNKPLHTSITIVPVDSINNIRPVLVKSEDSTKQIYGSIASNENYLITVRDSAYEDYRNMVKILEDSTIILKLKRLNVSTEKDSVTTLPNAVTPTSENQVKSPINNSTILFIFISAFLLLALLAAILYVMKLLKRRTRSEKEYQINEETIFQLQEQLKSKDAIIEKINNDKNFPIAQSLLVPLEKEQDEVLAEPQKEVPDIKVTMPHFVCEIMMTAGPRKKFMSEPNADKDLGEDVCGFVAGKNNVLFWVLDGTSDLHCLKNPQDNREYFSSRLLAQFLAEKLRDSFKEKYEEGFDDVVTSCIDEVKKEFLEQINNLPEDEKFFLKKYIDNKNFPECATTLLIASLSLNGDFCSYRSGDSKMLLFGPPEENELDMVETSLSEKNEQSNDRLFFRLMLTEKGQFDIHYNRPNHEIINKKNISSAISFSDGVGMRTEQLLKEEYKRNPQLIRKEIIYQLQSTGDDKSICFIEIKETKSRDFKVKII